VNYADKLPTGSTRDPDDDSVRWEPAQDVVSRQTERISREFMTSRPKPRNRVMGFSGDDRGARRRFVRWDDGTVTLKEVLS
jgi:hypothetical protein